MVEITALRCAARSWVRRALTAHEIPRAEGPPVVEVEPAAAAVEPAALGRATRGRRGQALTSLKEVGTLGQRLVALEMAVAVV